ncbi:MAG TPA: flavin reductase family protein [Pseudonocardiaceae bacterium]|jgi:flavin reductase (DIM6/NTAB) family NADH-FMN oxidoreductase RutF|nr:flavin reductase family protein [Pseudonocardiaceae bacterium]
MSRVNSGFDERHFREVLGNCPTSVVAITAALDDQPAGMVVGTFTSVSLDPPLVSFLADRSSTTFPKIWQAERFCANVLAADQEPLCRKLAIRGSATRFSGVDWNPSPLGNPVLGGIVAWVDCTIDTVVELGDHFLAVGHVRDLRVESPKTPLLFFRGGYGDYFSATALLLDRLVGW